MASVGWIVTRLVNLNILISSAAAKCRRFHWVSAWRATVWRWAKKKKNANEIRWIIAKRPLTSIHYEIFVDFYRIIRLKWWKVNEKVWLGQRWRHQCGLVSREAADAATSSAFVITRSSVKGPFFLNSFKFLNEFQCWQNIYSNFRGFVV